MATEPTTQVGTRVLFENERVRVWDLALAPGESLAKHIHRNDYCFIVVSGGLIRFADPDNPAEYYDVQFEDDQVEFLDSGGGKLAYIVHDDIATRAPIQMGAASVSEIEVLAGLSEGDSIVTSSLAEFERAGSVRLTN